MSLASDYAALCAATAAEQVVTNQAVPPSFEGPNGRAEVTTTGGLRLVPTGTSSFEIPGVAALAFAVWIQATFG